MNRLLLGIALLCFQGVWNSAWSQTFEINGQSSGQTQEQPKKGRRASSAGQSSSGQSAASGEPSSPLGAWGGSLQAGRYARATQEALRRGNFAAAVSDARHLTEIAPNDARNWFLLSYASRLAGNYQVSIEAAQRGLQLDPRSVEGLSGLAQTYMRMGKADEAKRILLQVIAANPRRANDLSMAGDLFLQSGDAARAANFLERAEAVEPSSHSELLLAIAYMKENQTDKARQLLEKAKARDPKNVDIFRVVAQYYRAAHDYPSAIATLKSSPRKNAELLAELGYTYELAGMKKESADTYEKAAAMAPKAIAVQLAAGEAALRIGNVDKTRAFLERAGQLDPNHYRLHAIRGDLARLERRDEDATREYLAALANMPEGPAEGILYPSQVRLDLINTYKDLGNDAAAEQQTRTAREQIEKLQVEGPDRVTYLGLRASIKTLGSDTAGAEADLQEALRIDPRSDNITLQYGSLLWKTGRRADAKQLYSALLGRDQKNRYALEAMGYLSRDEGDSKSAENYFHRMAEAYPGDYVPYLALGDLYTSTRDFPKAEASYQQAYKFAPGNPLIISSAANAAIEAHAIPLAGSWLARATDGMRNDPRIMRENERYLFHTGKYEESARLGEQVIQKLTRDRDVAVYLAYDLYNLGRYDQVLALTSRYETILPREANFPLVAGHVHKQTELLQQSIDDYSRALEKDPRMREALVSRGYVRNDMQDAQEAMLDFESALRTNPDDGIARLGLGFSELQLRRSREALAEIDRAEKQIGESGATHMARATAYRQMRVLDQAAKEYQMALKSAPDDLKLRLALADTLYHARHYAASVAELENALQLSPDDPLIYANMASAEAQMGRRAETFRDVERAERAASEQSAVFVATGDALLTLGDRQAAEERFTRALQAPDANRVDVRLEFAKLFVKEDKFEAAQQQVALAFAEARIGEASPVTTDNMLEAANIFLSIHQFDLATRYFSKARDMGAADEAVGIGLANTYIAQGDDRRAEKTLSALGDPADFQQNFDYQMAWANVYNQRHDTERALSAFAHANRLSSDDFAAERGLLQVAGEEGVSIEPKVTMENDFSTEAVYDDATLYEIDAKFFGPPVSPRSLQQTQAGATFRFHPDHFLPVTAYFGERNFHGITSIPSTLAILQRNTYDTIFNSGVEPVLRLGNVHFVLNPGLEFTVRRDTDSPAQINQQLFRQFLYVNSSPIFNWITVRASAIRETGPFTEQHLHSRDLGSSLEFEVGQPWARTAFVTGYSVRDLLFRPLVREFFTTSTWAGVERKFGDNLTVTALGRYVRSWRVQDLSFATAEILVPGARFEFRPRERWTVEGSFDFTRGQGFHNYDNEQSGFFVSYMKPLRRSLNDGAGTLDVEYPLRISFGLQEQSFVSYTGPGNTSNFRPVLRISLF